MVRRTSVALLAAACVLALAGCGTIFNEPANVPLADGAALPATVPPEVAGDTVLALAFSGGGMRAAAFAHGVLVGIDRYPDGRGGSYLDRVTFVSGVSGGAVTAAYFGLKGRAALADYKDRFLLRNAEEDLRTAVSLGNLARGLDGGVNDASRLPGWLDRNLFEGATMGDLLRPGKPVVWINASDLYNRTPFHFAPTTFAALCSDLRTYPVSQAVAASAAVPVAFAPIVLESFPDSCRSPLPAWVDKALVTRAGYEGAQVRAFAEALKRYRDPGQIRYVKLSDGGLVDNFGLSGIVIARELAEAPYAPLTPDKAVRSRRLLFVVVNSGRGPAGDWGKTLDGPSGATLLGAVTDTAIDAAVRSSFDAFRLTLKEWEDSTRKWRCRLSRAEATRLGAGPNWRCSDIRFELAQIAFDQLEPTRAAKLNAVETRFRLPPEDVEFVVAAGIDALMRHPAVRRTLGGR